MRKRLATLGCAVMFCGAVGASAEHVVKGESVLLKGTNAVLLGLDGVAADSVRVFHVPPDNLSTVIQYAAGRDYVVNGSDGTISRTVGSSIPDALSHPHAGRHGFARNPADPFASRRFLVQVSYASTSTHSLARPASGLEHVKRAQQKLKAGGAFCAVVIGDSIARGVGLANPNEAFPRLFADHLQSRYPGSDVCVKTMAADGATIETSDELVAEAIRARPDMVLVAMGANDQTSGGRGVTLGRFNRQLRSVVLRLKQETLADIVILSPAPSNPDWRYGAEHPERYAKACRSIAEQAGCAYVDVHGSWLLVLRRKEIGSLLVDDMIHPTPFGHWIYHNALLELGL